MDALLEQITERPVDRALAFDAAHIPELHCDDLDGEMAFAAPVMTGMAAMRVAVVDDAQIGGAERLDESLFDFGGDGPFRILFHAPYIET